MDSSEYKRLIKKQRKRFEGGMRKDIGIYVRSRWEANIARYLNFLVKNGNITKWEYEPDTFKFPVKRGSVFYTPDFKIWEKDKIYYYEVKGYMDASSRTKLKRMSKYYPDIKIIVVDKKAYKQILGNKGLIEGWE